MSKRRFMRLNWRTARNATARHLSGVLCRKNNRGLKSVIARKALLKTNLKFNKQSVGIPRVNEPIARSFPNVQIS